MYDPQVYSTLLELRDDLFEGFLEQQKEAAEEILTRMKPYFEDDRIAFVVDLGCGTGEMLRFLRDTATRELPEKTVQYHGLDICTAEIGKAAAFIRNEEGDLVCQYRCHEAETLDDAALPVDWHRTLLTCVGHTLPHFLNWNRFRQSLSRLKPGFVLIDFYHSWDSVVERLQADPALVIREPRHVTRDRSVYSLSTCIYGGETAACGGRVLKRGIEKVKGDNITSTGVWTYQHHRASAWFRREIEELGYVLKSETSYVSGYGPMKALLLSAVSVQ